MGEVKGTLLGIVLAIAAFTMVFGVIRIAMKNTAETVQERMEETAQADPVGSVVFTLP